MIKQMRVDFLNRILVSELGSRELNNDPEEEVGRLSNNVKKGILRRAKGMYKHHIRSSKKISWERFVREPLESNPFGFAYKLAREKVKEKVELTSVDSGGEGFTMSTGKTMEELMDNFFYKDVIEEEDSENHLLYRRIEQQEYIRRVEDDFAIDELQEAIALAISNKAPGIDNIKVQVLKALDMENLRRLLTLFNAYWNKEVFP